MLTLALPSNFPFLSKILADLLRINFVSSSTGVNIFDILSICYDYTSVTPSFCVKILFILFIILLTRSFYPYSTSFDFFSVSLFFYMSLSLPSVSLNILFLRKSFINDLRSINLTIISLFS